MNVRRLEAEAIRDTLLAVSGQLEAVDVRTERARSPDKLHGRPRPARSIGLARRRRPAEYLSERQAQFPEPDVSGVRCAGAVLDDGPAKRLKRARPGAHPHERPARRSAKPGSGPRCQVRHPARSARERLDGLYRLRSAARPPIRKPAPASTFLAAQTCRTTRQRPARPSPRSKPGPISAMC